MSAGRLFMVVFAAVLLANLATLAVLDAWMSYQAGQLAAALDAQTQRFLSDTRSKSDEASRAMEQDMEKRKEIHVQAAAERQREDAEQRRAAAEQAPKAETERDRDGNAVRIKRETCETWRRFYKDGNLCPLN